MPVAACCRPAHRQSCKPLMTVILCSGSKTDCHGVLVHFDVTSKREKKGYGWYCGTCVYTNTGSLNMCTVMIWSP